MSGVSLLIVVGAIMLLTLCAIPFLAYIYDLNHIKSKTVGDGQHGTARWATKTEVKKTYKHIPFTPNKWREQAKNKKQPTMSVTKKKKLFSKKPAEILEESLPQGIVVGCKGGKNKTVAMVDTGDVHALMIGAAGVGKTAYWLYPCIEYALASGISFLTTDTKGDVMRNYGNIAKDYGYEVSVIDLRNPTRSNGNNLLHLVNKYMDLYAKYPHQLVYKAKAREAHRLAVAVGIGHAEVGGHVFLDGRTLVVPQYQNTKSVLGQGFGVARSPVLSAERCEPAHETAIVVHETVAVELLEIAAERLDEIVDVRTLGVARNLYAVVCRQSLCFCLCFCHSYLLTTTNYQLKTRNT